MKAESFVYKGMTFKPVGNILGGFFVKSNYITDAYIISVDNYSHKEFYKLAKKHHASCDVFEVNGRLYIPATYNFVGVMNNAPIKKCEEYERWYQ